VVNPLQVQVILAPTKKFILERNRLNAILKDVVNHFRLHVSLKITNGPIQVKKDIDVIKNYVIEAFQDMGHF
jgi:hypothetical protein